MIGVELLVCPHQGYQILRIAEIYNIMRPAREHMDSFDFITAYFKFNRFIRYDVSFLNQGSAGNDDEKFPF